MDSVLILSQELFLSILNNQANNFTIVEPDKVLLQDRYTTQREMIIKRIDDNSYWKINWTQKEDGSIESLYNVRVRPKQITVTEYFTTS